MKLRQVALGLVMASAFAGTTWADSLNFLITGGATTATTNRISYAGAGGPLIGTGIQIGSVQGVDTPANSFVSGVCGLAGGSRCSLSFTTGSLVSYNNALNQYIFNPGGSITMTAPGGIQLIPGGAPEVPAGAIVLQGSFASQVVIDDNLVGSFNFAPAAFGDRKHPALVNFYYPGLPNPATQPFNGSVGFNFTGPVGVGINGPFVSTAVLAAGSSLENVVPEPGTYALFGTVGAFLGLGLWRRRRAA